MVNRMVRRRAQGRRGPVGNRDYQLPFTPHLARRSHAIEGPGRPEAGFCPKETIGNVPRGVARCVDTLRAWVGLPPVPLSTVQGRGCPEATMNFAWFSALSRGATVVLTSAALGALMWSCGGSGSGYCDDTGCYSCDGYGCSMVSPPPVTPVKDGGGPVSETGSPAKDTGALACSKPSDCGIGKTCSEEQCVACGSGSAGACPCTTDGECAAGQECYEKACVTCGGTGGPCPCAKSSDCSNGDACIAGSCEPSTSICMFSNQCASGDVCDDGQCLGTCSSSAPVVACPAGSTCTKGACVPSPSTACKSSTDCNSADPYCVGGVCVSACTNDSQCSTGDYCDQGACVIDTRPQPNCTDASECLSTEQCVGGYCRYTCTTSNECALHDARIAYCSGGICVSESEAMPQCTTQTDCPSGQDCISNQCQ